MPAISLKVNGKSVSADVEARLLLVELLRERLAMTGTHVGCDTSQCGACTVQVDGRSVKSCTMLAVEADGREVTTIEGLAANGELSPMQAAFRENHGLQCGFCTPGMLLTAHALLKETPRPTRAEIIAGMDRNLCRCGAHRRIVLAIEAAAAEMAGGR